MSSGIGNEEISRFYCTKHSWKGKYKRVVSIGTTAIATYNPNSHESTNQWPYNEVVSVVPSAKASNEFTINTRKAKKNDKLTFSSDYRLEILTEVLRFSPLFADDGAKAKSTKVFPAFKYGWPESKARVDLVVRKHSLAQVNSTGGTIAEYDFKDIEFMARVTDSGSGFIVSSGGFGRLHMFICDQRDDLMKLIQSNARDNVGFDVAIRKESVSLQDYQAKRLGKFSEDECVISLSEFKVLKYTPRHPEPTVRIMALSESCIVERDPATYSVVTVRPLSEVYTLVRYPEDPQLFSIEYTNGKYRKYTCTDRDALLCSILDGVRASGNRDVCVKMQRTKSGMRLGPLAVPVEEEVESQYLRYMINPPPGVTFAESVARFNANVSYNGLNYAVTQDRLFAENKEKLITQALQTLLQKEGEQSTVSNEELEAQFHALRRLVASKAGFEAFTTLPNFKDVMGFKVLKALKRGDEGVTFSCVDFLCALMQPMHDNYDLRYEQLNKSSLLFSAKFVQSLLDTLKEHIQRGTGALVISALLDFFTFALCPPYGETTPAEIFDVVLGLLTELGRHLFKLFQHPSLAIVKAAGLLMKTIIEEGTEEMASKMQQLALSEGALPRHLHNALYIVSTDNRLLTLRQLSRHLVGLWYTGNPTAIALLGRVLPLGLVQFLDSEDKVPETEADRMHIRDNVKLVQNISSKRISAVESTLLHWRSKLRSKPQQQQQQFQQPVTLRKRRQIVRVEKNWPLFYYKFMEDHATASLIWNFKTREELREALENEIRSFNVDKDLSANTVISWNYTEFEVRYESLADEIKIGDYYLRLLLEEGGAATKFVKPQEFFSDLYHRFLLSPKSSMKSMCLQAMAIVYGQCYQEIGPFNDTPFMMHKLDQCQDRTERDRLILFIDKLLYHKHNAKLFLDAQGVKVFIDILTLAHLHTSRAYIPTQTNVLEAAPDSARDTEKEWYFSNKDKEKEGPYSFKELKELWAESTINQKTRLWAQGMDGWRPLEQIAQLKWTLLATGTPLLNESELSALILDIFVRVCQFYPTREPDGAIVRPLPRANRQLSEPNTLPHLANILLTFDPKLVEKTVTLLSIIMEDNPQLPRMFTTGVFFFIMMYTGSNVLPIAKFLKATHTKQSFRSEDQQASDIMQRSILGSMLPEAMMWFLENYEPQKFSETFLGEYDTPEAIWSGEMRRLMIEKIAGHIAEFSPRLQSNTRATYQYCSMAVIQYPQLEDELFCNIYYLRHLCNTSLFPDWPIKEPVKLLKDVLVEWKKEVEKKGPEMSIDQAYETLGLAAGTGGHEEGVVRKAYFKLAQKYHPDKNPDGGAMFEAVNKAYEFLCSRSAKRSKGADPARVVLLLKTQAILFTRCAENLKPYKYAGYPMLIRTIEKETTDSDLFSKSAPVLTAASEVAFHTMDNSALNAEELRREGGIPILQSAFTRCLNVLSLSSKTEEMAVQVCTNICRCYRVSAQFEACRAAIVEVPAIVKDVCRAMYYKNLPRLNTVAVQSAAMFAADAHLQEGLLKAGVFFHMMPFLFKYDYTLAESGVETSDDTHQQEVSNSLAKVTIVAVAKLAGLKVGDDPVTPSNHTIHTILRAFLTPYVVKLITRTTPGEVLKVLNSNTENPYLVWDNRTRAELNKYLEEQQQSIMRSGECDPTFGEQFTFDVLRDELVVGEVYIRVYNEQPTFVLEDAKGFATSLLDFMGSNAQYLYSLKSMTSSDCDISKQSQLAERLKKAEMTLEALFNVIHNNPGVEVQCLGHFKLLFSLLATEGASKMQLLALKAVSSVTGNKACVSNIADAGVLQYLLLIIYMLPASHELALEVFQGLTSNTQIVKESIQKGALIYLLNLFCNSTLPAVRDQTASLLAKMITDKLVGPKVRIVLCKFLPLIFMDAMRDNSEASLHMFDNKQENPELIWNDESRAKVSKTVKDMTQSFFTSQKDDPTVQWKLPEDFEVVYTQVEGEIVVGGVFLRLFINQPTWVLRKPKEFLIALLEKFILLIQSADPEGQVLETVTNAACCLFVAQPSLADQVPPLGHIPRIFERMRAGNESIPRACVLVVQVLAESDVCVRSMSRCDAVAPIIVAMKRRPDIVHTAAESIKKMFELNVPELVVQAVSANLVPYLLSLLESSLTGCEKPTTTKAVIAEALKAMQKDLVNGEKIREMLEASPVWSAYRDQKHDLFISSAPVAGYLTGGVGGVAGYLTAGSMVSSTPALTAPPPLKESSVPDDVY
ncbi:hypothetical protein EMCRGX_G018795 [Ephydatia muelleri]